MLNFSQHTLPDLHDKQGNHVLSVLIPRPEYSGGTANSIAAYQYGRCTLLCLYLVGMVVS